MNKIYNQKTNAHTTWPIGNDLITLCAKTLSKKHDKILKAVNLFGI